MENRLDLGQVDNFVLTSDVIDISNQVNVAWNKTLQNILLIGRLYAQSQKKFGGRSVQWKTLLAKTPFSQGTVSKLCRIGNDTRLFDNKIGEFLPPHWGSLYEITKMTDKQLYEAVGEKLLNPETSRQQIVDLRRRLQIEDGRTDSGPYLLGREHFLDGYFRYIENVASTRILTEDFDVPWRERIAVKNSSGNWVPKVVERYSEREVREIEKYLSSKTIEIYSVRVTRSADISTVEKLLEQMSEITKIPQALPFRIKTENIELVQRKSKMRLLILCDQLYDIYKYQYDKRRMEYLTKDIVERLDHWGLEHPLFELLCFYISQIQSSYFEGKAREDVEGLGWSISDQMEREARRVRVQEGKKLAIENAEKLIEARKGNAWRHLWSALDRATKQDPRFIFVPFMDPFDANASEETIQRLRGYELPEMETVDFPPIPKLERSPLDRYRAAAEEEFLREWENEQDDESEADRREEYRERRRRRMMQYAADETMADIDPDALGPLDNQWTMAEVQMKAMLKTLRGDDPQNPLWMRDRSEYERRMKSFGVGAKLTGPDIPVDELNEEIERKKAVLQSFLDHLDEMKIEISGKLYDNNDE